MLANKWKVNGGFVVEDDEQEAIIAAIGSSWMNAAEYAQAGLLIAAAPALLGALQELLGEVENENFGNGWRSRDAANSVVKAREAIKQALGA